MGTVYILQSLVNNRYYIGSTNDLVRRLEEHNKENSKYTKLTRPFKLVFSQEFRDLEMARRVEYKLKRQKSKKLIEKIIKDQKILMGA